jgi:hypothetical protein
MNRIPKEKRRPYVWKKSTNLKKTLYEFLFLKPQVYSNELREKERSNKKTIMKSKTSSKIDL